MEGNSKKPIISGVIILSALVLLVLAAWLYFAWYMSPKEIAKRCVQEALPVYSTFEDQVGVEEALGNCVERYTRSDLDGLKKRVNIYELIVNGEAK